MKVIDAGRGRAATIGLLVGLLGCTVLAGCRVAEKRPRPNVVIVVADALRASNLSLYGYPRETAPHLTELARDAVVFEHHLANAAATPLSVSQMQSGLLAPPLLMDATPNMVPVRGVEDDMLIFPRFAGSQGYRRGLVSAHPWFNERARLLDHFDSVHVAPYVPSLAYAPFADLFPAIESFLRSAAASPEPFLLYVHVLDTHRPFRNVPPPKFSGTPDWPEDYDEYDSEIDRVDVWTHELVLLLRELGEWDDTIFVFTSDHGEEHFEMGPESWHGNHGQSVSRAAVHVPLVVRLPDRVSGAGRRVPALTRHVDLAPTLARLIDPGVELDTFRLDGRDIGPLLRGESLPPADDSVVRAFRFRGVHDLDGWLEYDSWSGSLRSFTFRADAFNYPRPVEREVAPDVRREDIERRLRRIEKQFEDLSPMKPPAQSILAIALDPGSAEAPTRVSDAADQKWSHPEEQLLECGPAETPRAALRFAWFPGRYRIYLRTSDAHRKYGYRNRLRVEIDGDGPFDAPDPDEGGLIDLGVHTLGAIVRIGIEARAGGVALTGLLIESEDGDGTSNRPSEEVERQLRALGYL